MASAYGGTDVAIDSYLVGKLQVTSITVEPALVPRLCVTTEWILTHYPGNSAEPKPYSLTNIRGKLRIAEHGVLVGTLAQVDWRDVRSSAHTYANQLTLAIDLDHGRLEKLEDLRQGSALRLWA